jgi:hypothetical protein
VLELDPQEANLTRLEELGREVFTAPNALLGYVRRRNEEIAGAGEEVFGTGENLIGDSP